jgi:integrase
MHCDGGGLYLQVTKGTDGALHRSWLYRFAIAGRERQMGLGSFPTVGLAEARAKATDARKLVAERIDPIERRDALRASVALADAKAMTFDDCCDAYIQSHRAGWRNVKHAAQWTTTLETYITPIFGKVPVQAIDTGLITKALEPIWTTIPETASRLRGRIELVLDWAAARGHRKGDNPARWRGHLDKLLPAQSKMRTIKHHAALPYTEIGAFMADLRKQPGISARALEFLILTAARSGEVRGARWSEIDITGKAWTVPAERMKSNRPHRLPLAEPALAVLTAVGAIRQKDHVFPGQARATLSGMAFTYLLHRMGRDDDLTVHGFRSTFRDWAAERTNFPSEVAEMALAHAVGSKVEAAYRRGDLFEKRRRLMDAWGEFCAAASGGDGKIISIRNT